MQQAKSFEISRHLVMEAYLRVKANKGTSGVDGVSIEEFEKDLRNNLYKIWNRMSSGSYLPPAVRLVEIPKGSGGTRPLGIPTVGDRVAQMVTVMTIGPDIEPLFHEDSYAYQRNKSALDAITKARERCFKSSCVVDLDIRKFFDTIDHELLIKALNRHVTCKWAMLYIQRWLTVPYQLADGTMVQRDKGVPQGSVIGPILANLFLHYAFDEWMKRNYPDIKFERYADDTICHCGSMKEAEFIKSVIQERLAKCKLELNETKTKIVYCKKTGRNLKYACIQFDFLGYTFRPRGAKDKAGNIFTNFSPAISNAAKNKIRAVVRSWNGRLWVQQSLTEIASKINPVLQGWINYYGKYNTVELKETLKTVNLKLSRWVRNKFKGYGEHKTRATYRLGDIAKAFPWLFAHWRFGVIPTASPGNRKTCRKTE